MSECECFIACSCGIFLLIFLMSLSPKTVHCRNIHKCDQKTNGEGVHGFALSNFVRYADHQQYLWIRLDVMKIEPSFAAILEWICFCFVAFLQKSHLG